jgi:hypothetical protein
LRGARRGCRKGSTIGRQMRMDPCIHFPGPIVVGARVWGLQSVLGQGRPKFMWRVTGCLRAAPRAHRDAHARQTCPFGPMSFGPHPLGPPRGRTRATSRGRQSPRTQTSSLSQTQPLGPPQSRAVRPSRSGFSHRPQHRRGRSGGPASPLRDPFGGLQASPSSQSGWSNAPAPAPRRGTRVRRLSSLLSPALRSPAQGLLPRSPLLRTPHPSPSSPPSSHPPLLPRLSPPLCL